MPELLRSRLVPVYGKVIPSLAPSSARAKESLLFAIGSERHVAAYERELAVSLGPGTRVVRLAPRDFW